MYVQSALTVNQHNLLWDLVETQDVYACSNIVDRLIKSKPSVDIRMQQISEVRTPYEEETQSMELHCTYIVYVLHSDIATGLEIALFYGDALEECVTFCKDYDLSYTIFPDLILAGNSEEGAELH